MLPNWKKKCMMKDEIWKDVEIFGGRYIGVYQVSNFGRLKSLARLVDMHGRKRQTKDRIIKGDGVTYILALQSVNMYISPRNLVWDTFYRKNRVRKHVKFIDPKLGARVGNLKIIDYGGK